MEGEFFSKVHLSLSALLALQKENQSLGNGLTVLRSLLEEGSSSADEGETTAVRSAVIVGIRVLADGSLRSGSYASTVEHFATILCWAFDGQNLQLSLKWMEHVRPLLAILLSDLSGSNHCVQLILLSVRRLVAFLLSAEQVSAEFHSSSSTPVFGKLVSVCLEVITTESRSIEAKESSIQVLSLLASDPGARNSLSVVLPGLESRLCSFLCLNSTTNVRIIRDVTDVMFKTASLCLEDDTFSEVGDEPAERLMVRRDLNWAQQTAQRLLPMISNVSARLAQNRDETVRISLLIGARELSNRCKTAFGESFRPVVVDLILLLLADEQNRVIETASKVFEEARSDETVLYVMERLSEMSGKLPNAVRVKIDGSPALKQSISILSALSGSLRTLAMIRSPVLLDFIRALASTIRVNVRRLSICLNDAKFVRDLVPTIPLKFDVATGLVVRLARILAENADTEVVDLLSSELIDCSQGDRVALLLLQSLVVDNLPSTFDSYIFQAVAECCCDELDRIPSETVPVDVSIEDLSEDVTDSVVQSIALLACLASVTKRLKLGSNKIYLRSIYKMLVLCSSHNWVLSAAAGLALEELATSRSCTVSSFLMTNNSYLLSRVELASRSFEAHTSAPLAFGAFLDRVDDGQAFLAVRHQVDSLLTALDIHKQRSNLVVLRALKSFCAAMNRWFPEMKRNEPEVDEDGEEEEEPIPREIVAVEMVLNRTKHLLSSDAFPVRILVMDILIQGLRFLRHFDNQLLPMIHQNWLALIHRLDDENLESKRTAFMVMVEMARISKSFVYRRIVFEAWPRLSKWLEKNVQRKRALSQSTSYRFAEAILSNCGRVFVDIGIREEDWPTIRSTLALFQAENLTLKNHSKTAIATVEEYLQSNR